jgi:hypothetical protein
VYAYPAPNDCSERRAAPPGSKESNFSVTSTSWPHRSCRPRVRSSAWLGGSNLPSEEPILFPFSQPSFNMRHRARTLYRDDVTALAVVRSTNHSACAEPGNHAGYALQRHVGPESDVHNSLHATTA